MDGICEGIDGAAAHLRGKRVGLVANHTAVTHDFRHLVDVLREKGVNLVVLFGPEHGFYGEMDEQVSSTTDSRTGLPVHSLYGPNRKPTPDMLHDVDALVFSIQDVGARFYTYISTMAHCLEAAAGQNCEFLVIDRPNPITGARVEGNLSEAAFQSFVAVRPLPIRHGMTIGELARMFNGTADRKAALTVARIPSWNRAHWFDQTGWPWVMPSPAMPTLTTAAVYPGVCLLEGLNVSVGRGTSQPFERIGAPWIHAFDLADAMNALSLPGVRFRPAYFVPTTSKYEGQRCAGVQIHITDRDAFQPINAALHLTDQIRTRYPDAVEFQTNRFDRNMGTDAVRKQLEADRPITDILAGWTDARRQFERLREKYLLYP